MVCRSSSGTVSWRLSLAPKAGWLHTIGRSCQHRPYCLLLPSASVARSSHAACTPPLMNCDFDKCCLSHRWILPMEQVHGETWCFTHQSCQFWTWRHNSINFVLGKKAWKSYLFSTWIILVSNDKYCLFLVFSCWLSFKISHQYLLFKIFFIAINLSSLKSKYM